MPNTLINAEKFSSELDKVLVQKSAVGFLTDNAFRANFVGAKIVKIPDIQLQGLGDYDRDTGFLAGTVNVANTPYELTMDRARSFQIDREDMDETGVANLAGEVLSEFVRTKVVPETDAYVLSKLAGVANEAGHVSAAPAANGEYKKFIELCDSVRDVAGYDEELVAFVDAAYWSAMKTSTEISRHIDSAAFKQGGVDFTVKTVDGVPIIPVSSARMKTAYTFAAGENEGDECGFTPAENAKNIRLIVMPKKAAMLVKKSEKIRTFTPDQNLKADAYKFDYRVYYDAFVKKSYTNTIFACTAE